MMSLDRRRFMRDSALCAAGALVGGRVLNPGPAPANAISREPVLVAYDTMFGSTKKVAEEIGRVLESDGSRVEVRLVDDLDRTDGYRAVVVGSSIRSDAWLDDAVQFVADNQRDLKDKPTAYFLTCLTLARPDKAALAKAETFLDPVLREAQRVKPVSTGLFGGVLDYSEMSWMMKMIMKRKMSSTGLKEGDYRDWRVISAWADGLKSHLTPKSASPSRKTGSEADSPPQRAASLHLT